MKLDRSPSVEVDTLNRCAEDYLLLQSAEKKNFRTDAETQRLLDELQINLIELHVQNAELRRARDDLEVANTDLEAFNYSVAHELRQYLMIITCYCQVTRKLHGRDRDDFYQEYLEEIHQGSLAMDRLIETLLTFAKVGKVELHRQPVDLSAIAKSVAAVTCRCTCHITPGILVDADPDLLRIVLNNLLGNACKFAGDRDGMIIEFGVMSVNGKQTCFVRDNGPGFDMALADQLFLPFQRLPGMTAKGHGVGLATVERIVRSHGGRVWAESEIGKGATFFFTLD